MSDPILSAATLDQTVPPALDVDTVKTGALPAPAGGDVVRIEPVFSGADYLVPTSVVVGCVVNFPDATKQQYAAMLNLDPASGIHPSYQLGAGRLLDGATLLAFAYCPEQQKQLGVRVSMADTVKNLPPGLTIPGASNVDLP